jgi:XTP/dITP diphosphohydrolase
MSELVPEDFDVAETEQTFAGNAWLKAMAVCQQTHLPALADDSGLEVDALGGRPGVYSARYAGLGASDDDNNRLLLQELAAVSEPRTARFRCVLALAVPTRDGPTRLAESEGTIEGQILRVARGQGGFGYDPLFEPVEAPGVTTAEMSPERKNEMSHRARAARALIPALGRFLDRQ